MAIIAIILKIQKKRVSLLKQPTRLIYSKFYLINNES